ncbi:MAG: YgeY family selenium metabolism-linked hydrolase [Clostridia bacterium]|nr:YgeY family selenium metabolism-linked hydrolase [Clostridia bacterium]
MDYLKIKAAAEEYQDKMTRFLRDMIAIPGESGGEEGVSRRVEREMRAVGFDRVEIDPMGNVLGYMGSGRTLIAYDAHIDTVGVGNTANWSFDPYDGYETDTEIGGRGSSDQLGGMAAAVYGAKIMKDLNLLSDQYTVLATGTVQEEDCDGLCWQYIIQEDIVRPELVVITEPTDGRIYRGQRGRMEIRVDVQGVSCHGSAPERGDNAIYKMADILQEVRDLNHRLPADPFLGKATLTASEIFFSSPSRCAVADSCSISIDRRLTGGETCEKALEEVRGLPSCQKYNAQVSLYKYTRPSWTNLTYPSDCTFPAWSISENHPAALAMIEAYKGTYGNPIVDKWTFSTNGVSIMGRFNIPCIGFGPGQEAQAHAPNEKTWKADLVKCAAVYAALPTLYCKHRKTGAKPA